MNDSQLDDLLHKTVSLAVCEECCHLEQQAFANKKHRFSRKFKKKMKALLKEQRDTAPKEKSYVSFRRLKPRYLLLIILLVLLSSITVLAAEPIRQKLHNIFYTIYDDYLLLETSDQESAEETNPEQIILYKPTYVPEGFEFEDSYIDEEMTDVAFVWINKDLQTLFYEQLDLSYGSLILSSNGKEPYPIKIGETDGKLIVEDDGYSTIFYEKNSCIFAAGGPVKTEDLLKMLLSLKEIEERK